MRIHDILFWHNKFTERNPSGPQLDLPPASFSRPMTNLANAFTRSGSVKHFWNLDGSEGQSALWTSAARCWNCVDPERHVGTDYGILAG